MATFEDPRGEYCAGSSWKAASDYGEAGRVGNDDPCGPRDAGGAHRFRGQKVSEPKIGIVAGQEVVYRKIGPGAAFVRAGEETWRAHLPHRDDGVKLVTRVLPSETLGGPILIAQIAGDQARQGVSPFAYFLGLLSVNLGILNLLPIPSSSTGGHLLFFSIEGLMRKPISPEMRTLAHQVAGLALILTLTALVFYNDIARLLSR